MRSLLRNLYYDIKASYSVFEMANLSNKDHKLNVDLKIHIDQPGDKLPPHYARVKVFRGDYKTTQHFFVITLPDIKVIKGNTSWLSNKELKRTITFIDDNKNNFIEMFKDQGKAISDLIWKFRD